MKLKLQLLSLCFIFCIFMMSAPVNAENNNIFESYDNTRVIYGYLENGVTYIPIGEIWRQFGNQLSFDVNEQKIFFSTNQGAITLGFQSAIGEINGETITLSNPTKKIQNTVYASVRDVAKLFNIKFDHLDKSMMELLLDTKKLLIHIKPITSAYLYHPKKIDVIMYHHFDPNRSDSLTVTPERFREHLDKLIQAGYETITEEDLYQYKTNAHYKLPKKPLLITIDDGYANNYSIAYPILKEKGLRATIYIITSYRGKQPGFSRHFTWEEAKEMYDSGVINIESHTHDLHYYVQQGKKQKAAILARNANEDERSYKNRILNDLKTSRDLIRQHVGKESIALSYPYGVYDKTVIQLAKEAGFKLHVTIKTDKNLRDGNPMIYRVNAHGDYSGEQLLSVLNS